MPAEGWRRAAVSGGSRPRSWRCLQSKAGLSTAAAAPVASAFDLLSAGLILPPRGCAQGAPLLPRCRLPPTDLQVLPRLCALQQQWPAAVALACVPAASRQTCSGSRCPPAEEHGLHSRRWVCHAQEASVSQCTSQPGCSSKHWRHPPAQTPAPRSSLPGWMALHHCNVCHPTCTDLAVPAVSQSTKSEPPTCTDLGVPDSASIRGIAGPFVHVLHPR